MFGAPGMKQGEKPRVSSTQSAEQPRWVFWSTRESIDNDVPSVTAILETIIAVPAYWFIAIHFSTYLPLLFSIAVAPLVLLRSDESIELGIILFTEFNEFLVSRDQQTVSNKILYISVLIL